MSTTLTNSVSVELLTEQGIAALKAGDKRRATELLNEAVQIDPHNERAWLWLSGAVTDNAERRHCLEWVLAINPENSAAQRGLAALPANTSASPHADIPTPVPAPAPTPATSASPPAQDLPDTPMPSEIVATSATDETQPGRRVPLTDGSVLRALSSAIPQPASPPQDAGPETAVTCRCGKTYHLRDEFVGRTITCPECHEQLRVLPDMMRRQTDSAFDRDKFLLRQKHLSLSEKYYIWDEQNHPILFIERPRHLLRNLGATLAAAAVGMLVVTGFIALGTIIPMEVLSILITLFGVAVFIPISLFIYLSLAQKRHITFYRDDSRQEPLLQILQDQKLYFITASYTVHDAQGEVVARLRKNHLYDIFRKHWHCHAPDGSLICTAKEDSIVLSLMRRILNSNLFGLLRTNFIIVAGPEAHLVGEFNRKFTILDRYVLDMSYDARRMIDRRIALALGVMLDTGERR
ncbi:MAG: hypothetical protein ACLFVO_02510 [Chloroflexaceae bacterium]